MARGAKKAAVEPRPVEGPWDLPEEWRWERLGNLCSFVSRGRGPTYVEAGGVKVFNQRCVRWKGLDHQQCKLTSTEAAARLPAKQHLIDGDILWNSTGTGTIGRAAIYRQIDGDLAVADSHVTIVRLREADAQWVCHWISTSWVQQEVAGTGSTNQVELARQTVIDLPVPVPPRGMEPRLLTRIIELFTEIDDGERSIAAASEGVRTYRKALLKAAVTGDLTADWRVTHRIEETGVQLLDRVLRLRRANHLGGNRKGKASYREPQGPLSANLPRLPSSWAWATLEQLSSVITSGSRGWADYYSADGPIFIRAANLNRDNLDLTDVAHVTPPSGAEGSRTSVKSGDVLITITGANVTKAGRVESELGEAYVSQHVGLVRPIIPELSDYLYRWVIAYGGGRGYLEAAAYGAGKPGLSLENLRTMPVALPPPSEIRALLGCADHLAGAVEDFQKPEFSLLRQSILAAAFRGDLVT